MLNLVNSVELDHYCLINISIPFQLLIDISRSSNQSFNILNTTDLITNILKELDGKDLLVLVNIIEILTKLGLCRHGLDFLETNGSLDKIFNLCKDDDTVCIELCEPGNYLNQISKIICM